MWEAQFLLGMTGKLLGEAKDDFGGTQTKVPRLPQGSAAAGLCCGSNSLRGKTRLETPVHTRNYGPNVV